MANLEPDNVYQAPESEAALPVESERPMRWLVLALDVCLAISAATQVGLLALLSVNGGSLWRLPAWVFQVGQYGGYAFYLGCFLFLVFVYRAHRNARALGVRKLRVSSQGAVVRFLIPVANLFLGYVVMRELWKYSDKPHRASSLVLRWWLACWAYQLFTWFAVQFLGPDARLTAAGTTVLRLTVIALFATAAFLTSRVVHGVQARQAARARRLAAD